MSYTKQKALDYLKSNADITEIFATSDGFLFTKKADATEHAKTLTEDEPEVETFTSAEIPKEETKKPSIAELKVLKEKIVAEYTELFKSAPDEKLTAKELQKLIDAEKLKTQSQDA